MFVLFILLYVVNAEKKQFIKDPQLGCLISITSHSCDFHGFETIDNKDSCDKAAVKYLDRSVPKRQVDKSLQWHSPPGCYHNFYQAFFNRRTTQYYDDQYNAFAGEGTCSDYYPCVCITGSSMCPEIQLYSNHEDNSNHKDINIKYATLENEDVNQTKLNQTNIINNTVLDTDLLNQNSQYKNVNDNFINHHYQECPHSNIENAKGIKACSMNWFSTNKDMYSITPDSTPTLVTKWLNQFSSTVKTEAFTKPTIIKHWTKEPSLKNRCFYIWWWGNWCYKWHDYGEITEKLYYKKISNTPKQHLANLIGPEKEQLLSLDILSKNDKRYISFRPRTHSDWSRIQIEDFKTKLYNILKRQMKQLNAGQECFEKEFNSVMDIFNWNQASIFTVDDSNTVNGIDTTTCICSNQNIILPSDTCNNVPKCNEDCFKRENHFGKNTLFQNGQKCAQNIPKCACGDILVTPYQRKESENNFNWELKQPREQIAIQISKGKNLYVISNGVEHIQFKKACVSQLNKETIINNYMIFNNMDKKIIPICTGINGITPHEQSCGCVDNTFKLGELIQATNNIYRYCLKGIPSRCPIRHSWDGQKCILCSPGTFQDTPDRCLPCKTGTYAKKYGSLACFTCASGQTCSNDIPTRAPTAKSPFDGQRTHPLNVLKQYSDFNTDIYRIIYNSTDDSILFKHKKFTWMNNTQTFQHHTQYIEIIQMETDIGTQYRFKFFNTSFIYEIRYASNPCYPGEYIPNEPHDCNCNVNGYEHTYSFEFGTGCQNIDDCASNPCQHGECVDKVAEYECQCTTGYSGTNCEINIDDCASNPCQNGVCIDKVAEYECQCTTGYSGTNCETNIDECASNPCQNGACDDKVADYVCQCVLGWEGKDCDINIDDCSPNPCQNNAICIDKVADYGCQCVLGWEGTDCDININDCASNPCQNGTCIDKVADYECQCVNGYSGTICDTNIDDCSPNPCQNGACVDKIADYECQCVTGWEGKDCDTNIDDCASNPCQNGVCVDKVADYECQCVLGWEGTDCEMNIDDCTSQSCNGHGACSDTNMGHGLVNCNCDIGYEGDHCNSCNPGYGYMNTSCILCDVQNFQYNKDASISNMQGGSCAEASCPIGMGWNANITVDISNNIGGNTNSTFNCVHCQYGSFSSQDDIGQCVTWTVCGLGQREIQIPTSTQNRICEDIDDCSPNPCQNGACVDKIADYECQCTTGWEGKDCDTNIDDCASNSCQNNAICVDKVADYECQCVLGWEGKDCEINIDDCSPNPCQNGECVDKLADYECQCGINWIGKNCSEPGCRGHSLVDGHLTIGNSVTSIGSSAFRECIFLTSVSMPNSVVSIGNHAFAESNLNSVSMSNSLRTISHFAFYITKLTSVSIPDSVVSIGNGVFQLSPLTSLNIGNSVTSIGNNAFEYCQLTSVDIPNSIQTIGTKAFAGYWDLNSIIIRNTDVSIGTDAFPFALLCLQSPIPNCNTTCVNIINSYTCQ